MKWRSMKLPEDDTWVGVDAEEFYEVAFYGRAFMMGLMVGGISVSLSLSLSL